MFVNLKELVLVLYFYFNDALDDFFRLGLFFSASCTLYEGKHRLVALGEATSNIVLPCGTMLVPPRFINLAMIVRLFFLDRLDTAVPQSSFLFRLLLTLPVGRVAPGVGVTNSGFLSCRSHQPAMPEPQRTSFSGILKGCRYM